jgi:hypothetical protein
MEGTHVSGQIIRIERHDYIVVRLSICHEAWFSRFAAISSRCGGALHVGTHIEGLCKNLDTPTLTSVWKEGH